MNETENQPSTEQSSTEQSSARGRADRASERTRHHVRHEGTYFDVDGRVDVTYGDGTAGSLAEALRAPESDSWRPRADAWEGARWTWAPTSGSDNTTDPTAADGDAADRASAGTRAESDR